MRPATLILVAVAASIAVTATACGGGGPTDASTGSDPARLNLPGQILGLQVQAEEIQAELDEVQRPYVDSVAVFSLREDELLRASLQIARFNRAARPDSSSFRGSIVSTIGGTEPQVFRMEDVDLYTTTASDQVVFTWFRDNGMFVLAVQQDFEFPRTLVRRFVERDLQL